MKFRPLGIAKEIIEDMGMEITYSYDDLLFIEHSAFIIQFDDNNDKNLFIHFNVDCEKDAAKNIEETIVAIAKSKEFTIENKGLFEMKAIEDKEELQLKFYNAAETVQ